MALTDRLTAGQIIGLGRDRAGRGTTSRHDLWLTLNRAGRSIYDCHPWTWRTTGSVELVAVVGQDWIELPADYAARRSIVAVDPNAVRVQELNRADIDELRSRTEGSGFGEATYVCLEGRTFQRTPDGPIVRTIEVFPTPTTAGPVARLTYDRRWTPLYEKDPDAIPSIPPEYEEALLLQFYISIARAIGDDWTADAADLRMELEKLKASDARNRTAPVPIRGGAARFMEPRDGISALEHRGRPRFTLSFTPRRGRRSPRRRQP